VGPTEDPDGFRKREKSRGPAEIRIPNRAANNLISISTRHKTIRAHGL